jgi:hypothetical protein
MIEAETVDRVVRAKGDGLPVISLYVRVLPQRRRDLSSQLGSLLDQVEPFAYDQSLSHEARLSLRKDLERINERAELGRWRPGTVGIFACSGRGLFEEVQLPRRVHDRVVVDSTPWVRPLVAALAEFHRACVVFVNRKSARMWELYQDEMREVSEVVDPALRKSNYAHGRVENRVHNRGEELLNRHYRRVVDELEQLADRYELLIIGGQEHDLPGFVEFLPPALRTRVAGTFTLDPNTATSDDIRHSADTVMRSWQQHEQQRAVTDVLDSTAAGALGTLGLQSCLWAGSTAAVQSLVVAGGAEVPGVVCDESGWLGLRGEQCPLCGAATRKTDDVIDELVTATVSDGGTVQHVPAESLLQPHLVGARLRFPLPPVPPPLSQG